MSQSGLTDQHTRLNQKHEVATKSKPKHKCLRCGCTDRYPCIIDAETGETCTFNKNKDCCSRCWLELGKEIISARGSAFLKNMIKKQHPSNNE